MADIQFKISIPSDADGFVGRACRARSCGRYFKVQRSNLPKALYCPYCNTSGPLSQTHTREQIAYVRRVGEEKIKKYAHDEIQKMLAKSFGGLASRNPSVFKFTPGPAYRECPVAKNYRERTVDTHLCCPDCGFKFQVFSIFGFCPKCQVQNAQIYDTNLAITAPDAKIMNDYTDMAYAAYATFYDGLLTEDKKLDEIYAFAARMMRRVFLKAHNQLK